VLFDLHLQEQINLGRGSSGRSQRHRNPQHQTPKSLTKNWAEATRLLRLAVAQGHADAHIVLADLLFHGDRKIVFKDSDGDEAMRLLQLVLEQGSTQRHLNGLHCIAALHLPHAVTQRIFLTSCRYHGRSDYAEAFKHFKLAYDAGSSASRVALTGMYHLDEGVAPNVPETLKLFMLDPEESCKTDISSCTAEKSLKCIRDFCLKSGN
jgi:TPR repeat protein